MRTTLDVVDDLYQALNVPAIKSEIDGDIYKHRRLLNSRKVDIVINSLPINSEQLQNCIGNVNIHVPDIEVNVDGNIDYQPDHVKLKELTTLVLGNLEVWEGDYHFSVQQQTLFKEDGANEHFVNIRVNYYSINL